MVVEYDIHTDNWGVFPAKVKPPGRGSTTGLPATKDSIFKPVILILDTTFCKSNVWLEVKSVRRIISTMPVSFTIAITALF